MSRFLCDNLMLLVAAGFAFLKQRRSLNVLFTWGTEPGSAQPPLFGGITSGSFSFSTHTHTHTHTLRFPVNKHRRALCRLFWFVAVRKQSNIATDGTDMFKCVYKQDCNYKHTHKEIVNITLFCYNWIILSLSRSLSLYIYIYIIHYYGALYYYWYE